MTTLEIITKAIQLRKPFSYEYNAPKHVAGIRFGNPHAIFIHPTTDNINMDVWKTGGVVTDPLKPIPGWRQYKLEFIFNVTILESEPNFTSAVGYNPNSKQYARIIVKL